MGYYHYHYLRSKRIINKPGLSALSYRIGTYSSFRWNMIKSLKNLLVNPAGAQTKKTDQILLSPVWGDVGKNDYTTALIEMWAYLLEILSYYNERIINESYIGTARLKESLLSLCDLVNHGLDPGVSASAYIAIKAEKNKTGIVPAGFKIQTKATGVTNASGLSKPSMPLVFETDSSILIYDYFNEIGLKVVWDYTYNTLEERAMSHVLQGKSAYDSFKPDDHVLFVQTDAISNENQARLYFVSKLRSITMDDNGDTVIEWSDPLDRFYPVDITQIFILRELFRPFGYNAPYDNIMPKDNKGNSIFDQPGKLPGIKTTEKDDTGHTIKEDIIEKNHLRLDKEYDNVNAGSFIVLSTGTKAVESGKVEVYQVTKVIKEFAQNYGLSSNVTTLILDHDLPTQSDDASLQIRDVRVLGTLANGDLRSLRKASEIPKGTNVIELDNFYPNLYQVQYLSLEEPNRSEICKIAYIDTIDDGSAIKITLAEPLAQPHDTSIAKVCLNIVPASHGETIKNEIIGSGDASIPFDTFKVKQSPVTFIHSPQSETGSISSLNIIIDGVEWREVRDLVESKPTDRHYISCIDEKDVMSVTFGDGKNGATPPSRQDNILASYRKGIGLSGNVATQVISSALSSSPVIKSVANPLPAFGGADRESIDEARVKAPKTMQVLERAVSIQDYENLALLFTGIAKCKAFFSQDTNFGEQTFGHINENNDSVTLVVAAERGEVPNISMRNNLRKYMDRRRDTNVDLRIRPYTAVQIDLSVDIQVKDDYLQSMVIEDVKRSLIPENDNPSRTQGAYSYFSFERMDFGKTLHVSDIYSTIGKVAGVQSVLVKRFTRNLGYDEIMKTLTISSTEIAVCSNDLLTINAQGGIFQ